MSQGVGAVIVAAGSSDRMEGIDKIMVPILGSALITHTIQPFEDSSLIDRVVIVTRKNLLAKIESLANKMHWKKVAGVIVGGERRGASVKAGLKALEPCEFVVVHDGARPCLTTKILEDALHAVRETGAAVAAIQPKDTIKQVNGKGLVTKTPLRKRMRIIQTPQVFSYKLLSSLYETFDPGSTNDVTDDATLAERMGHPVKVFPGSYKNIKVTTPDDLSIASIFIKTTLEERDC